MPKMRNFEKKSYKNRRAPQEISCQNPLPLLHLQLRLFRLTRT